MSTAQSTLLRLSLGVVSWVEDLQAGLEVVVEGRTEVEGVAVIEGRTVVEGRAVVEGTADVEGVETVEVSSGEVESVADVDVSPGSTSVPFSEQHLYNIDIACHHAPFFYHNTIYLFFVYAATNRSSPCLKAKDSGSNARFASVLSSR